MDATSDPASYYKLKMYSVLGLTVEGGLYCSENVLGVTIHFIRSACLLLRVAILFNILSIEGREWNTVLCWKWGEEEGEEDEEGRRRGRGGVEVEEGEEEGEGEEGEDEKEGGGGGEGEMM